MPAILSPRLERLRVELANSIPCSAADRPALLAKHITDVIIEYLTWKARMIRPRRRTVDVWPEVTNSSHYAAFSSAIADIKHELETGADMNARLSNQVRTKGYAVSPPADPNDTPDERKRKFWRGKDRARIVYDVHHLHMGPKRADGTVGRTGELLFVGITEGEAYLLTIGDHHSFDDQTLGTLMETHIGRMDIQPGAYLAGPAQTLGGGQMSDTFKAIDIVKTLRAIDELLAEQSVPDAQVDIHLEYDDIVLFDHATGAEAQRFRGKL